MDIFVQTRELAGSISGFDSRLSGRTPHPSVCLIGDTFLPRRSERRPHQGDVGRTTRKERKPQ
jgi:hypothetical protein